MTSRLKSPDFGSFNIYDNSNANELIVAATKVDGFDRSGLILEPNQELYGGPYRSRNYHDQPFGTMDWGSFSIPTIPRSEWPELIKRGNENKSFGIHHHQRSKVAILNQARTNYCWINCVVGAIMNTRVKVGLPNINLSSASAGAPGKNYQNVGGWTGEAIRYINRFGLAPNSMWPNAAIERSYYEPTRRVAAHFGLGNWVELRPRNFDQLMTCLLMGWEVVVGLIWWGHAVYYNAPVQIGRNEFGVICVNSWGPQWENKGMTVLAEEKATADEANAITTVKLDGWEETA